MHFEQKKIYLLRISQCLSVWGDLHGLLVVVLGNTDAVMVMSVMVVPLLRMV